MDNLLRGALEDDFATGGAAVGTHVDNPVGLGDEFGAMLDDDDGVPLADYINQMLLMEASFLLRTSELSITQIADRLHFAGTPSFSKFFSRLKGQSPRAFREQ